jgi:hypothetical protein
MTCFESNIEPGNNGVDEIISMGNKFEIRDKREIRLFASVEVEVEYSVWIGDYSFHIDGINEWLPHGYCGDRRKVETVDGFPESNFFLLVVGVFNTRNK